MNQLHPRARWLFRLRAYFGMLIPVIFLSSFFFGAVGNVLFRNPEAILGVFVFMILFIIFFVLIVGEIYARMSYNRWLYEFGKEHLKIERGIIWKRYSNVPYERVQNVDIRRGILARIFGFSELEIQTAGYSMQAYGRRRGFNRMHSEGYIPAVEMGEAEKIREFLMKKISKKGQGL